MTNKLGYFAVFAVGAIAGIVFVRDYFRKWADAEIQSVKEAFAVKAADDKEKSISADLVQTEDEYEDEDDETENINGSDTMHTISSEEYGENDEYETLTLYYHSDDVLVDSDGEVIDDVESSVGEDILRRFGESVENSIYVRNPVLKCDYEILIDNTAYSAEYSNRR